MVEFISYDGKWPALCIGTLELKIDGEKVLLFDALISGGCIYPTEYIYIENGFWSIDADAVPPQYHHLLAQIAKVVNENVPQGCCGGCI